MGQIIGGAAKPKRCNFNQLSQLGTPAAGEHILVSSDNSMNAAGQGNFDAYIVGDNVRAATALPLQRIVEKTVVSDSNAPVRSSALFKALASKQDALGKIDQDGLYITDEDGNVITRLDMFDTPQLSRHFEKLTGVSGKYISEDGFYIVDMDGNIVVDLLADSNRKVVTISTSDTEVEILTKMLQAFTVGNADVVFEHGTYTFSSVYTYMRDTLGWSWTMELPIGNGCHYYFNNSTLISNAPAETYTDSRNILGCKAGAMGNTSFKLFDGILINNGGTYCVHDECLSETTPYQHEYHNMRMVYNSGSETETLSKCIGGGAGPNGMIVIENCVFSTDNPTLTTEDVSWHGMAAETSYCNLSFFVSGNYFSRKFRVASSFKAGDTLFVKYNGNSAASAPNISDVPTTNNTYIFNNTNL